MKVIRDCQRRHRIATELSNSPQKTSRLIFIYYQQTVYLYSYLMCNRQAELTQRKGFIAETKNNFIKSPPLSADTPRGS